MDKNNSANQPDEQALNKNKERPSQGLFFSFAGRRFNKGPLGPRGHFRDILELRFQGFTFIRTFAKSRDEIS